MKRRKHDTPPVRTHSWETPDVASVASWERDADSSLRWRQEQFGNVLENALVTNYARGKLTAKSLCDICFFAVQSGAVGDGLRKLALDPQQNPGNYQAHLDRVLPQHSAVELCKVWAPMVQN
eukprot:5693023-Pyramimonas_sp.AAC.1